MYEIDDICSINIKDNKFDIFEAEIVFSKKDLLSKHNYSFNDYQTTVMESNLCSIKFYFKDEAKYEHMHLQYTNQERPFSDFGMVIFRCEKVEQ